jgi:PIN domain
LHALLDTHALLWWLSDDPALPRAARKVITETKNILIVSAASAWEIAIKVRLGKLPTATDLVLLRLKLRIYQSSAMKYRLKVMVCDGFGKSFGESRTSGAATLRPL